MKSNYYLAIICGLALIFSCAKGEDDSDSCNGKNTRRDIKIAIDANAIEIDTIPILTTVNEIGLLDVPESDKNSERQAIEKKVFQITAKVHKISQHRDGDWKVKLTDENEQYINCESPNLGCEHISGSIFYSQMLESRKWILENKTDLVGKTVTITGIAFIDIDHKYPRNAAENELELHPILDIHF
ncbi:MAG: hypothetical protein GQ574_16575 [Crocinitomix sp.]|nr:hypothetical protein [Crocinitomix sp.]